MVLCWLIKNLICMDVRRAWVIPGEWMERYVCYNKRAAVKIEMFFLANRKLY